MWVVDNARRFVVAQRRQVVTGVERVAAQRDLEDIRLDQVERGIHLVDLGVGDEQVSRRRMIDDSSGIRTFDDSSVPGIEVIDLHKVNGKQSSLLEPFE